MSRALTTETMGRGYGFFAPFFTVVVFFTVVSVFTVVSILCVVSIFIPVSIAAGAGAGAIAGGVVSCFAASFLAQAATASTAATKARNWVPEKAPDLRTQLRYRDRSAIARRIDSAYAATATYLTRGSLGAGTED